LKILAVVTSSYLCATHNVINH